MTTNPPGPRASPPETRRAPTMKDVADLAGVSRQLVSMVMRGAAGPSEASRGRVIAAARELGFHANSAARMLRQSRTRLIGVVYSSRNTFESLFVESLIERAAAQGLHVALAPVSPTRTTDAAIAELFERRVEALACFNPDRDSRELDRALDLMPVVWLGERSGDARADTVRPDDGRGLLLAVEHLRELGHTRISYAGGSGGVASVDRARAYRSAMAHAGLGDQTDVVDVDFDEESGATAARMLLERPALPTALIAGSDRAAVAARTVFAQHGVSVPGQISVIGYDDSEVARLSYNALTSVRQDVDATVEAALRAIVRRGADLLAAPVDVATTATLSVRGSTGAPRTPSMAHDF